MSQFKAGDLALVINAKHSGNIGKVVKLLRYDDSRIISYEPYGFGQASNPNNLPAWVVKGSELICSRTLTGEIFTASLCAIRETNLMPLRGDFIPETERETELTL